MEAAPAYIAEVWPCPVAGVKGRTNPCVEVWQSQMEAAQAFIVEAWLCPVAGGGGRTNPCIEVWQSPDLMYNP